MNSSMRAMVFGVVVLGGSLIACKGLSKKMEEEAKKAAAKAATSAVAGTTGLTAEDQADMATSAKLGKYITCTNLLSRQIGQAKRRYASWMKDYDKGPQGNEKYAYGIYELHNVDQCKRALSEAKPLQPALPEIEKLASDWEKALDTLVPLVKKAHDYYDGKKHEDDKFAEGKTMHGGLKDALDAFLKVDDSFNTAIGEKNDALLHKAVDRVERTQGKKFAWHKQSTMLDAQDLIKAIGSFLTKAKEYKTWKEMPESDVTALGTAIDKFEAKVKQLTDYAATATDKPILYSFFESELKKYVNASRELWRRRRDKKQFSMFESNQIHHGSGWMVEGSYDKVLKAYNDLIDRSNAMNR